MERRQGKVNSIAPRVTGHELMPDVRLYDFVDRWIEVQQGQSLNESEPLDAGAGFAVRELFKDGLASDQFMLLLGTPPPHTCPLFS